MTLRRDDPIGIRSLVARLREWIAVDDPEERIEGSGGSILSPQHRRILEAERVFERLGSDVDDEHNERR